MAADKHNAELLINRVKNSSGLEANKQWILDYYYEQLASGVKYGSMTNYLKILSRLVVYAKKPFKKLKKTDLVAFFMDLKPCNSVIVSNGKSYSTIIKEYSPQSLARMKTNIKIFWRWMCKGDKEIERDDAGTPMVVSWIKANYRRIPFKYPKDALSRSEVEQLIKATASTRTKAIIAILFESGMRAGEFLGMKKSQIQFYDDYCEFVCDGKTGKRPVVLIKSYPYLKKWLAEIEARTNIPKDFSDHVWITTENFPGISPKPMLINSLRNVIEYTAKKTDITKRIWLHGLRHSSATDFVKQGYNEAEMRLKFGWTATSDMPSNYTHYKHDELKSKILSNSGKASKIEKIDGNTIQNTECPFCSIENPIGGEYCYKCGRPMTIQKIKESEKQEQLLHNMQSAINELKRLEEKGFNLQAFNTFNEQLGKSNSQEKG